MIVNMSYKRESFLANISLHLTGSQRYGEVKEGSNQLIYFGAGYWRGIWSQTTIGGEVCLINPDVSNLDADTVERALCILRCGEYKSNP